VNLPNFLVIGAAKAGTTSLHHYLRQHPEIFMCPKKDTFFFDFDGRDPDFAGPGDNDWYRGQAVVHLEEYQILFADAGERKAVGEACAGYLYDPEAPARIHRYVPDAKLIAVLRDPIERAYSSFLQQVRDGYETETDFAAALALEEKRIREHWRPIWHYRERGFYYRQLKRFLRYFERSRIRVYLYEDLQESPVAMLGNIFEFLEVDADFEPDTSVRHNRAGIPRSRRLHELVMKPNALKMVVKPLLPPRVRGLLKAAVTDTAVSLRRPPVPPEVRERLVQEYRPDVLELQEFLGRDLSHWLS
jgi:hypothetical protein